MLCTIVVNLKLNKMTAQVRFKEVEENINFTNVPIGGIQLYNPDYRTLPINEVIRRSAISEQYVPYGYNSFILVRSTGTIHAFRD